MVGFSGNTKIITDRGVFRIADVCNNMLKVTDLDGNPIFTSGKITVLDLNGNPVSVKMWQHGKAMFDRVTLVHPLYGSHKIMCTSDTKFMFTDPFHCKCKKAIGEAKTNDLISGIGIHTMIDNRDNKPLVNNTYCGELGKRIAVDNDVIINDHHPQIKDNEDFSFYIDRHYIMYKDPAYIGKISHDDTEDELNMYRWRHESWRNIVHNQQLFLGLLNSQSFNTKQEHLRTIRCKDYRVAELIRDLAGISGFYIVRDSYNGDEFTFTFVGGELHPRRKESNPWVVKSIEKDYVESDLFTIDSTWTVILDKGIVAVLGDIR